MVDLTVDIVGTFEALGGVEELILAEFDPLRSDFLAAEASLRILQVLPVHLLNALDQFTVDHCQGDRTLVEQQLREPLPDVESTGVFGRILVVN